MCFSATASFTLAIPLLAVGTATLTKVKETKWIPMALGPLLFGIQQLLEGINWITINQGDFSSALHHFTVYGYLLFAGILWPIFVPYSVYKLEQNEKIKKILVLFIATGAIIAILCLLAWIFQGITVTLVDNHISYPLLLTPQSILNSDRLKVIKWIITILYFIGTVGALLISTVPRVWILGLIVVPLYFLSLLVYRTAFTSVWCFFVAISSVLVYYVVAYNQKLIK